VPKKLTFLDKAFWLTETDNNPKHVASLQILQLPEDATSQYLTDLVAELKSFSEGVTPFNTVVSSILGFPFRLKPTAQLDMDYHVQYHLVDNVENRDELHKLTARLHEPRLATKKPLWQFHVIEGREGRDFAIYIKIHHMYGDGATLVRWFQDSYSVDCKKEGFVPIWTKQQKPKTKRKVNRFKSSFLSIWYFFIIIKDIMWILFRILIKLLGINKVYMPVPFTGTKTILTGQVKAGRVVSTTDISFDRIQALSRKLRATVNEILLCCFDIGVHRFLKDHGQVFEQALFTNMPINMRKPGDESSGNKIAIVPVELAHGQHDPFIRLRQIIENHRIVKRAAKKSHPAAFSYYTVIIQSFSLIYELLHISDWVRPIANILVSNIPGPKEQRYLKDAKLKAVYPISTITPGGGVNITLLTYDSVANIGIVCCDRDIKSLEPLAQYFNEAMDLLENCIDNPDLTTDDLGEIQQTNEDDTMIDDEIVDEMVDEHVDEGLTAK